ncbi:MAG: hypothetical protein KGZ70_09100 [Hydrogenophaga sp.]|nr:hypothetical protein [Hydrogenophaga sp.]
MGLFLASVAIGISAQTSDHGKPVVKVGEVATYAVNLRADNRLAEETVTITSVDDKLIKYITARSDRTPADMEGVSTAEWSTIQSGSSGSRFDPSYPRLKFPLVVGETWKGKYEVTGLSGARSKADIDFKVVAKEQVTTPAGTYEAFKVESSGWVTGVSWQGSFRTTNTTWYAPAIHRIVKSELKDYRNNRLWNDTVTELKSFKPAP